MSRGPRRRILFVCTANICRSPTAELLARHHFGEEDFVFRSAGFMDAGRPCSTEIAALLESAGIDASEHRSYRIDQASIDVAELILVMEAAHLHELTAISPDALAKSVPLKEAASILDRSGSEVVSIEDFLALVNTDRDPHIYLDKRWDVEDPIGGKARQYRAAVTDIDDLVRSVISRLY